MSSGMSSGMTGAYLLAKCKPLANNEIVIGKPYRIMGRWRCLGMIVTPIKIEDNSIFFKGYVRPAELDKILLFDNI